MTIRDKIARKLGYTPRIQFEMLLSLYIEVCAEETRYVTYLNELQNRTPHDNIKQEIEDVLYPTNNPNL
jgi:hypothetical protein